MRIRKKKILSDGLDLAGHFFEPHTGVPGVLFVHGWAGSQTRDQHRSRKIARLGCICLTFDMRGHGRTRDELTTVTPAENLSDICHAFDALAAHSQVDASSIAVVGSSYGAYLATFLTAMRPVRWLALRVPALYRDEDWTLPKHSFDREMLETLRSRHAPAAARKALENCRAFRGDVLIVESEKDEIVAHPAVTSYLASFLKARSVTYRVMEGADHALTEPAHRRAYEELLVDWIKEMVFGAR